MPTSPYAHLYYLVEFLSATRPTSLLDIGLGNGKLGFIARDLLDVMIGERYHRKDWRIRLDGIEIFGDYIQDHQRAIYDQIHIGDAFEVIDRLESYDIVILGDVLEHFPKDRGWLLLDKCAAHAHTGLILFVPLGNGWKQPAIYGNPHEEHRSAWHSDDFSSMSCQRHTIPYSPGPYGAFMIKKADYIEHRIAALKQTPFFAKEESGCDLRHRYDLTRETIAAIDLAPLAHHAADYHYCGFFMDRDFREHYRLLACLSHRFKDAILFDIGTLKGYSALAMSHNPANRVVSYDIQDFKRLNEPEKLTTIEYCIGDAIADPRLLHSSMILLDTNHDGEFENRLFNHLKHNHYQGLLVLDDIHLNEPMRRFWAQIDRPKEDVTDLGHWSGTGLVDFRID